MSPQSMAPVVLEAPTQRERTWFYPWAGVGCGVAVGILIGHPLAMLAYNLHECWMSGTTCNVTGAILHSFDFHMWPMMLLFAVFGGISWGIIGLVLKHLRENRLRLDTLHQEFEFQVATLRHQYKNLAIGIQGFSGRIQKKLGSLDETFRQCLEEGHCPKYEGLRPEFDVLERQVAILEEAAQRLTHTLSQELLFLKALTSDTLTPVPQDFYPFLVHCVDDLLGLRFREKEIRVEINGHPLNECRETLVFPFEPYSMEVILQNILANAMRFGDLIQIRVAQKGNLIQMEVQDNGPGMDAQELKRHLMIPFERRVGESTHLGLKVSIHLLEKIGGRLWAYRGQETGAVFTVEVPRHFAAKR